RSICSYSTCHHPDLHSFPTRRSSDLIQGKALPFLDTDLVPLGLVIPNAGNYTIAINSLDGLFESTNQDIFLEDTYTGIIHDLRGDRKSTRLNSSHVKISYAVFCLKKK